MVKTKPDRSASLFGPRRAARTDSSDARSATRTPTPRATPRALVEWKFIERSWAASGSLWHELSLPAEVCRFPVDLTFLTSLRWYWLSSRRGSSTALELPTAPSRSLSIVAGAAAPTLPGGFRVGAPPPPASVRPRASRTLAQTTPPGMPQPVPAQANAAKRKKTADTS
jgi:hypothetical protein